MAQILCFTILTFLSSSAFSDDARLDSQHARDTVTFDRYDWGGDWLDSDGDCLNTRAEMLAERSEAEITVDSCIVRGGEWTSAYTGLTFNRASDVAIDHVVPLKHAHGAGGAKWPALLKRIFANDAENLLIVDDAIISSKGAKAPHEWMPPNRAYWCEYLARWQVVKQKYRLLQSQEELQFLSSHQCNQAAGQSGLSLPDRSTTESRCSQEMRLYQVKKGDTLYSISKQFPISIEQLQEMIGTGILQESDVLTLPANTGTQSCTNG